MRPSKQITCLSKCKIKHFGTECEDEIFDFVIRESESKNDYQILLYGESGCGKTETAKAVVRHIISNRKKPTIIYLEMGELEGVSDVETFCNYVLFKLFFESKSSQRDVTQISKANTFLSYLDRSNLTENTKGVIVQTIYNSLTFIPNIGSTLRDAFSKKPVDHVAEFRSVRSVFFEYFKDLNRRSELVIVCDNLQKCSATILETLYSALSKCNKNPIGLISTLTTKESEIDEQTAKKYELFGDCLLVRIGKMTIEEFETICKLNLSPRACSIALSKLQSYYASTEYGNFKEIGEFVFQTNKNGTVTNLSDSPIMHGVKLLDDIKKDILSLTALFPCGIKKEYVGSIVRFHYNCGEREFDQSLMELSGSDYVVEEESILKPGHDKIIENFKTLLESPEEEERFADLMALCGTVFLNQASYENADRYEFIYCVQSLLAVKQEKKLLRHVDLLARYVALLHDMYQFDQICDFFDNLELDENWDMQHFLMLLPLGVIDYIFDAYQKSCRFEKGLEVARAVKEYLNVDIHIAKYNLQSYKYENVIEDLRGEKKSYEQWLVFLNAMQHCRLDSEVRAQLKALFEQKGNYPDLRFYHIITRNSGHLFEPEAALSLLQESANYFKHSGDDFAYSTCLNNMGIVHLRWSNQFKPHIESAISLFEQAGEIMERIDSRESYQSRANLGIAFFCLSNYSVASEYLKIALDTVPSNLTFDIVKLKCNLVIVEMVSGCKDSLSCIDSLLSLYAGSAGVPDPWLRLFLDSTLDTAKAWPEPRTTSIDCIAQSISYPGDSRAYGHFATISYQGVEREIMLGVSPHWRY